MKSCGVSLTAAAAAAVRSLGVPGNDGEKMASGKATEIEEDFPKLTVREKETLVGVDRLVSALGEQSLVGLCICLVSCVVDYWQLPTN